MYLVSVTVVNCLYHLISLLQQVDAKFKYLKQLRVAE